MGLTGLRWIPTVCSGFVLELFHICIQGGLHTAVLSHPGLIAFFLLFSLLLPFSLSLSPLLLLCWGMAPSGLSLEPQKRELISIVLLWRSPISPTQKNTPKRRHDCMDFCVNYCHKQKKLAWVSYQWISRVNLLLGHIRQEDLGYRNGKYHNNHLYYGSALGFVVSQF